MKVPKRIAFVLVVALTSAAHAQWPQWGGPNRDFTVETSGLADKWPDEGPPKLWHRELGDGYSAIVVDDGALYTMYRTETMEFSVALDAQTGKTLWDHAILSPRTADPDGEQISPGPNSTPLVCGERLYTIGTNSVMHCFDKRDGKVLWKHDFIEELGGQRYHRGYSSSPLAYRNLIIATVGREQGETRDTKATAAPTLVAMDQESGDVVWKSQDYPIRYSSPILIQCDGQAQVVLLLERGVMGVSPETGELLWRYGGADVLFWDMTPVWLEGNLLVVASGRETRAIRLTREGGKTVTADVWSSGKLRFPQNNPVQVGRYLCGSSGAVYERASIVCAEAETGKRAWAAGGFALATCVYGNGKLIILDENGQLALATPTPEGLTVHSTCRVTERESWTAPTLVGTTLYVRDRKHIMALDVGV